MRNMLKVTVFLILLSFLSLNHGNVLANDKLTLLSPNAGEVIPSGSSYTIQWEASPDAVKFDLMYSIDGGLTWELISDGVTITTYDWYVPVLIENESNWRIRITGYNLSNEIMSDAVSSMAFTIEAGN